MRYPEGISNGDILVLHRATIEHNSFFFSRDAGFTSASAECKCHIRAWEYQQARGYRRTRYRNRHRYRVRHDIHGWIGKLEEKLSCNKTFPCFLFEFRIDAGVSKLFASIARVSDYWNNIQHCHIKYILPELPFIKKCLITDHYKEEYLEQLANRVILSHPRDCIPFCIPHIIYKKMDVIS